MAVLYEHNIGGKMRLALAILTLLSGVGSVSAEVLSARKVPNDPNMNFWELHIDA
jgi:hypothetical protein